jgi:hypothetical protein
MYQHVILRRNGEPKVVTIHRLILMAFIGPCPEGHEARHLNGNPLDNRLENLAWGTRSSNQGDDKRLHGTMQSCERNGQAKLTREQVHEIRRLRPTTKLDDLARQFSISRSQVKRIVYGKSWVL